MTSQTPAPRRRGPSVRVKLALSYAGFVVIVGVALFAVGFLLLRFVPEGNVSADGGGFAPNRSDLLEVFVRYAWWTLGLLTVIGLVGGWLLAGRMLQPLERITDAARRARDGELDHRIGMPGLRDELTDLADTFDDMLGRVQDTVEEQRRFAANASHELRTPHAVIRTMLEVARADPGRRDTEELLRRVDDMNERSIALTESLLKLSRVEHQALPRQRVDLAVIAAGVIDDSRADATAAGVRIDAELSPAPVDGDPVLLTQLTMNLVQNAIVHNVDGPGALRVRTSVGAGGEGELLVVNTGPVLAPAVVATLTEPFMRGAGRTRGDARRDGSGLGLAIVAAIVRAHDGRIHLKGRREGGLLVRVGLPGR